MSNFKYLQQEKRRKDFHALFIYSFNFLNVKELSDTELINEFIHSQHFAEESVSDIVKLNPESYLRSAFKIGKLNVSMFKEFGKWELILFYYRLFKEEKWDISFSFDFKTNTLNKVQEIIPESAKDKVYLLSMDWFDRPKSVDDEHSILNTPEAEIYVYYFWIIWVDRKLNQLIVCEVLFD